MRIEVDWELCDGQGVCAELAPTLFEVTDDDQVHVLDENPPASMEEAWLPSAERVVAAVRRTLGVQR